MPIAEPIICVKSTVRSLVLITALLAVPLGCVSKNKYDALNQSYAQSQQQLVQSAQEIQMLKQDRDNLSMELKELQVRHKDVIKVNQQLYAGVQALNSELEKKKSVIQIQQEVIRLLDDTKQTIESSLKDQIEAEDPENEKAVEEKVENLKLILVDQILFASGSTDIKPEGKQVLLSIAESMNKDQRYQIIVAGHTDNIPPSAHLRETYPTNWDLSAARASKVVRFLQHAGKVDPSRLSVKGYGPYRPVAPNDTKAGQQKNRRIEIILAPSDQ